MVNSVTVIIPCKNHGHTLERAVNSAADADEIIVINDHSTDDTDTVARRLNAFFSNMIYVDISGQAAGGVVHARNTAIGWSNSKLIIPLDADDYLLPEGLNHLTSAWKPGVFVYGGFEKDGKALAPPPPGMITRKNITQATICFSFYDWSHVGGYDPDFESCCEDWALTCAFVQHGIQPLRIEQPVYAWTQDNHTRSQHCRERHEHTMRLLKRKYPDVFYAQQNVSK